MSVKFKDKSAKVVVVDANGPLRQLISESIRGLGFEDVSTQSNIADLLNYLETEDADWVLVSMMQDQPVNALHLLKIISENPSLKHVRVTLALEEDESYVLTKAFELGLMSSLYKPFTKDSLPEDLGKLMTTMEENEFDGTFVAADFLREALDKDSDVTAEQKLKFEEDLISVYPGNPSILLSLAKASAKAEKTDQAKSLLAQVKTIRPDWEEKIDALAKESFGEEGIGDVDASSVFNTLGIKTAVIIDSDETISTAVKEIFEEIGAESIQCFDSGIAAWEWLDANEEPDVIIHEWRIPKLTGPMLIQKIRNKGFYNVPLIVLSSLIKADDMPLAREMGVSNIISKPLNKPDFLSNLIWTIQQERLPSETLSVERKIRSAINAKDQKTVDELLPEFLGSENTPIAKKRTIEAEVAFMKKDYKVAQKAGVEAIKMNGDSIILLNLLGKTFMNLNDYAGALRCFKKAQELSPNNIGRLCNIAESQMEVGDEEAAKETLEDADVLDPDNEQVAEGKVKVALAGGDTETARQVMQHLESLSGIISYMNNKAVAHSKCGFAEEAVEIYKNTIESVPKERNDVQTIVRYNLALALVRQSEFEMSVETLAEVLKDEGSKVFKKAKSLKDRLDKAIEKGESFELRAAEPPKITPNTESEKPASDKESAEPEDTTVLNSADDYAQMMAAVEARKGDLCCYMIYIMDKADESINQLLDKQPKFSKRDAIERNESFGAEMTNKSA
jgi:CheY-like chemotaxis protein